MKESNGIREMNTASGSEVSLPEECPLFCLTGFAEY